MPNQTGGRGKPFWDDRKSIQLTRIVTVAVFAACIVIAFLGPGIVDWLISRGRVAVQGPAVRWVMLGLGYPLAALALWMLYNLYPVSDPAAAGPGVCARHRAGAAAHCLVLRHCGGHLRAVGGGDLLPLCLHGHCGGLYGADRPCHQKCL